MKKELEIQVPDINCLGISCGEIIAIPTYVNIEQYDGDIRCQKCKSLMHLSLRKGTIVKYSMKDDKSEEVKGRQLLDEIASELKKVRNK